MACHCNLASYTYDNDPMFNAKFDPLTQRIWMKNLDEVCLHLFQQSNYVHMLHIVLRISAAATSTPTWLIKTIIVSDAPILSSQ